MMFEKFAVVTDEDLWVEAFILFNYYKALQLFYFSIQRGNESLQFHISSSKVTLALLSPCHGPISPP